MNKTVKNSQKYFTRLPKYIFNFPFNWAKKIIRRDHLKGIIIISIRTLYKQVFRKITQKSKYSDFSEKTAIFTGLSDVKLSILDQNYANFTKNDKNRAFYVKNINFWSKTDYFHTIIRQYFYWMSKNILYKIYLYELFYSQNIKIKYFVLEKKLISDYF